jgi:hypothetical protein
MFYSIVYVSGNFPEIFITRQRQKATRGIDLDTQHDLLKTNRAGPGLNFGSSAQPGPRAARPVLSFSGAGATPLSRLRVLFTYSRDLADAINCAKFHVDQ